MMTNEGRTSWSDAVEQVRNHPKLSQERPVPTPQEIEGMLDDMEQAIRDIREMIAKNRPAFMVVLPATELMMKNDEFQFLMYRIGVTQVEKLSASIAGLSGPMPSVRPDQPSCN